MTSRLGMNADAVASLAQQLDGEAAKLRAVMGSVEQIVSRVGSEWRGHDAEQFVDWWRSKHKVTLQRVHDSIAGLAQSAKNNVAEQRQASGTGGGSGAPVHGVPAPGHPAAPQPPDSISHGAPGSQHYSASRSVDLARVEVGTSRPTGWDQPGECVKSVQRWIDAAGGHFGGGGVVSGYENSGAQAVASADISVGDVLQNTSDSSPDSWDGHVHTVLVAGVNRDGTYDIIQSNSPYGSGLVTEVTHWTPTQYDGWSWRAWRFAANA